MKAPVKLTLLFLLLLFFTRGAFTLSAYELKGAHINKNNHVVLEGFFGKDCKQCEVIVDYGSGFKYAYHPKKWHTNKLSVTVKDLGKSLNVTVTVRTATNMTRSQKLTINPILMPAQLNKRLAMASKIDKKTLFANNHHDPFGGKGADLFKISSKKPACNQKKEVFHRAQLLINKKRFGNARIERKLSSACLNCGPLKVSWYHEPTGYISYQLQIQRRQIEGVCTKKIRR